MKKKREHLKAGGGKRAYEESLVLDFCGGRDIVGVRGIYGGVVRKIDED